MMGAPTSLDLLVWGWLITAATWFAYELMVHLATIDRQHNATQEEST